MKRILVGGCLHGSLPTINSLQYRSTDFVYLGDCCPRGMSACEQMVYVRYVFLPWMKTTNCSRLYLVPGNHDAWAELPEAEQICFDHGVDLIIDKEFTLFDSSIKCYGSPWTFIPPNWTKYHWAFGRDESELFEKFKLIPSSTDIIFTHTPPYGVLDAGLDQNKKIINMGSSSLRACIENMNFKVHAFCHEHFHGGLELKHVQTSKRYINVAQRIMEIII